MAPGNFRQRASALSAAVPKAVLKNPRNSGSLGFLENDQDVLIAGAEMALRIGQYRHIDACWAVLWPLIRDRVLAHDKYYHLDG
jgi:hypothetical protein